MTIELLLPLATLSLNRFIRMPGIHRFLRFVKKSGDCWVWTGNRNNGPQRYGRFKDRGKNHLAHRWIYESIHGALRRGAVVMHRCDNPSCVRPEHLAIGTQQQNVDDMFAKGRGRKSSGDRHPATKIKSTQVDALRAHRRNHLLRETAAAFGISISRVAVLCAKPNSDKK